jgi:hypothetical protein
MKEGFIERVDIVFLPRASRFFLSETDTEPRFRQHLKNARRERDNSKPLFLIALQKGAPV